MKLLPVAIVIALVAFSSALPVQGDVDASGDLSVNDLTEVVESLNALEISASEDELYFLKKIKRKIKKGIKVGIRIRPGYSAYNVEEMSGDLSFDELAEAVESIELLEASASESQLYFLKKIKRAIKKGIKIEARIRPAVAAEDVTEESDGLSPDEVADIVRSIDLLEESASESQLYFLKKIKRVIKRGVKIDVRIRPGYSADLESGLSSEELQELIDTSAKLEETELGTTYFWKKIKKGLKKVGKVVERGAKKVLERGVKVEIPI